MKQGIDMFQQAAKQPSFVLSGKEKFKVKNEGVSEAKHALGLAYYEGTGVTKNIKTAFSWWSRAVEEDGNGASANNIGCMYEEGELGVIDIQKAIIYWKFAVFDGLVRATQNLYRVYLKMYGVHQALDWYRLGVENGAFRNAKIDEVNAVSLDKFDSKIFIEKLKNELKCGPFRDIVLRYEETTKNMSQICKIDYEMQTKMPKTNAAFIVEHRTWFQKMRGIKSALGLFATYAHPAKLTSKQSVDIIGLKQIFFKDMDANIDKIYEGFAVKVTIIDDAIVGQPSVNVIAQDNDGDVQRIFLYNIPQNKETQNIVGYGCTITIVNPYHRIGVCDGRPGIRVDNPSTIIYHTALTNKKRCRYCGDPQGTIVCKKCQRVFYCSKKCLEDDATVNKHNLVCIKNF